MSFTKGQRVRLLRHGMEGIVSAVKEEGKRIEVEVGSLRLWVSPAEIKPLDTAARPSSLLGTGRGQSGRKNISHEIVMKDDLRGAPEELDLHGHTADEALDHLDRFLDQALRHGLHRLRVNHGKGSGVLKRAVQSHLKKHPLVERIEAAAYHEGSYGVTVVYLKGGPERRTGLS